MLGTLFEVLMSKNCTLENWRCRSTFWSSDAEKLHGALARSTFRSKMLKTYGLRALFEVPMSSCSEQAATWPSRKPRHPRSSASRVPHLCVRREKCQKLLPERCEHAHRIFWYTIIIASRLQVAGGQAGGSAASVRPPAVAGPPLAWAPQAAHLLATWPCALGRGLGWTGGLRPDEAEGQRA